MTWAAPSKGVLSGQNLRMEHRGVFLFDILHCSLRAIQNLEGSVYIAAFSALSVLNKFLETKFEQLLLWSE